MATAWWRTQSQSSGKKVFVAAKCSEERLRATGGNSSKKRKAGKKPFGNFPASPEVKRLPEERGPDGDRIERVFNELMEDEERQKRANDSANSDGSAH
jgi:hypothetical protein